jgi:hypothetical protein
MKAFAFAFVGLVWCTAANARDYAYHCPNPSGVTVPLPGAPTYDIEIDGISGGYYHITIADAGIDISYRDVIGTRTNFRELGAQFQFTAFEDDTARIDVIDPRFPLESFTFLLHHSTPNNALLTYVQVTPTSGITPRVSVFQSTCDVIRVGG